MKKIIISESQINNATIKNALKESQEIWYHGTPDARQVEQDGGFTERSYSITIINDYDTWVKSQELFKQSAEQDHNRDLWNKGDELYKASIDHIKFKHPIFLSDNYGVASTYADDRRAFDYQRAEPKIFKVTTNVNKTLKVPAHGLSFKGIEQNRFWDAVASNGISPDQVEDAKRMFHLETFRTKKGKFSTMAISGIAQYLGFDSIDVLGVLDSYNVGKTRSTVRIVFDHNNVKLA